MKKLYFGIGFVIILVVLGNYFFRSTNVVAGVDPVRPVTSQQGLVLDSLRGKSPEEIRGILDEQWPSLGADMTSWLRCDGRIKADEKVSALTFFYGSAEAKGEDAQGRIHSGHFRDELVAKFEIEGRTDPMLVAVRCTNGLFALLNEDLQQIGQDQLVFTVEKGKCLVDYVGFETAIHLAESFNLPIQKGRGRNRTACTVEEALSTNTDVTQISVMVYPGDEFDLAQMTYNGRSVGN